MPGPLDEPTSATDALSSHMSSFGPNSSTILPLQGTKRKASNMENVEHSYGASQTSPPIKLEPGSPGRLDYGGRTGGDTHPELHKIPTGYSSSSSSSSSDDTNDHIRNNHEDEGTATTGLPRIPRAAQPRFNLSSRDISPPVKKEEESHTARPALENNDGRTNGLLRMPPRPQIASRRPENPRRYTGGQSQDVDYNSIPDYTPPISTLPTGNPHIFHVEWRQKTFVDLSNDPDRHMLHEAELELATTLNLSCAKYLCTKRRMFRARLKALRATREFKRSDSQKACKINSNKASKLCGAFEKVGWFDKKYFVKYLAKSNNLLSKNNKGNEDRRSPSSGPTEPDIWDVSESDFHITSEGDEESTDDDTAESSVSSDGRYDLIEGPRNLDSYQVSSLRKPHYGLSIIGGDGSQRRVLIDRAIEGHDTQSRDEAIDEGLMSGDRRPRRGVLPRETGHSRNPDGLSRYDTDEAPVLETRSQTQKVKLALSSGSVDKSNGLSKIKASNNQQKSTFEKLQRRAVPTNQFAAKIPRDPIPHSLDEANAADIMLVRMKEKGRPWLEIEEAWEKETGKAQTTKSLSCRYTRIMANLASTRLKREKERDRGCSLTYPRLETDEDQLLLAAEAEIEANFQREKADIIAEIESNYRSEKWSLVAEAMSRTGSANYSAELIQEQYDRLTRDPSRADAKDEENHDTFADLPQQTTRTVRGGIIETSTPSGSDVGRLDKSSNASNLPQPKHTRLVLYQKRPDPKSQATTTTKRDKNWERSCKCKGCGRKYQSQGGLDYHSKQHPNCGLTIPRSYRSKKRKLNNHSNAGYAQSKAGSKGPFTNPPGPRVSFPNLTPHHTTTALAQVNSTGNLPALEDVSLGPSAEGAERGGQTVCKSKSGFNAEQSARMRKVWARRRALGTNGRGGGPPKAKTAKKAVPNVAPNAGIHLAPTMTYQSGHSPESLPNQTPPIVIEEEVCRDAKQRNQTLAQIIAAAPQKDISQERVKSSKKNGTKRHICRKCGMSYVHRSNHYRVSPNIGSEHSRRMAANSAGAQGHSGVTDAGAESTSDYTMGQMIFEISSREQSPELRLSRDDRELLGEAVV